MATDYGTDVSSFVLNDEGAMDLDPYFAEITGARVIAEAVARRWTSEKGSHFWDPDCGEDVRAYLNARFDPTSITDMEASLAAEAEKDERVARCAVLVTYEQGSKRLRIRGAITPAVGPSFQFVMPVDAVTSAVLGLEVIE
jgi:hypothetical protein